VEKGGGAGGKRSRRKQLYIETVKLEGGRKSQKKKKGGREERDRLKNVPDLRVEIQLKGGGGGLRREGIKNKPPQKIFSHDEGKRKSERQNRFHSTIRSKLWGGKGTKRRGKSHGVTYRLGEAPTCSSGKQAPPKGQ